MKKRNAKWLFGVLLALYPMSYLALSIHGFYEPRFFGPIRAANGDVVMAPRGLNSYHWTPFENTFSNSGLGGFSWRALFYMPLIKVDQAIWHRSEKVETLRYRTKGWFDRDTFEYRNID